MLEIEQATLTKAQILAQCKQIQTTLNAQGIDYTIAEAGYVRIRDNQADIWYVDIKPTTQLTLKDIAFVK